MDSSDGVSANPQRGPFIGRPMPRFEDLRLVRGGGRYTDDVSVAGYEVHRSRTAGFSPSASTLQARTVDVHSTDTAVATGTWSYAVVAVDAAGNRSAASAAAEVVVADTTAPSRPLEVRPTATGSSVELAWTPSTDDVAVVGRPDPDMGERVVAFVQPAPGAAPDDALAADLVAYARERLSHFKCPREVRFVDALPGLPTGKLLKRLLPDDREAR